MPESKRESLLTSTKRTPVIDISPDQIGLSLAEFLTTANIPESEKENFQQWSITFCNLIAYGNIQRWERLEYIYLYEEVCLLYRFGDYTRARELQGLLLLQFMSSRSIDGLGIISQTTSTSTSTMQESYLEGERKVKDKGLLSKLKSMLGG
jgi:hypothetical protein